MGHEEASRSEPGLVGAQKIPLRPHQCRPRPAPLALPLPWARKVRNHTERERCPGVPITERKSEDTRDVAAGKSLIATYGKSHRPMDIVSPEVRSRMMAGIRGKDTRPELIVRSMVHRMGLRFRLHGKGLPGRPDLVFKRLRTVILVHGCFWHRHTCGLAATPKTRPDFWAAKFDANVRRDAANKLALQHLGWRVIEVWECEVRDLESLGKRLHNELGRGG